MDILPKIVSGYLAGLSVGIYCLGLCLPIFLPILLSRQQTAKTILLVILEFSLGRLVGYLVFGIILGWLGQIVRSNLVHLIVGLANLWLGILMIVYSLGLIDKKFCSFVPFSKIKWPVVLGFLTGVNICPPFLGSLAYVFNLRSLILSFFYFLMFFLGTSTYIVPFSFLGVFSGKTWLQTLARLSGIIVGIYFIIATLVAIQ